MAKKPAVKPAASAIADRVDHLIGRGDMRMAVEAVRAAKLNESQFDKIMADHPALREAYHSV